MRKRRAGWLGICALQAGVKRRHKAEEKQESRRGAVTARGGRITENPKIPTCFRTNWGKRGDYD